RWFEAGVVKIPQARSNRSTIVQAVSADAALVFDLDFRTRAAVNCRSSTMDAVTQHSNYERLNAMGRELEPVSTSVSDACVEASLRGAATSTRHMRTPVGRCSTLLRRTRT